MRLFANDARLRAAILMRTRLSDVGAIVAFLALVIVGTAQRLSAADSEGVAVAIVYDTSGSMRESVPDEGGKSSPKYIIANRALISIANQLEAFATNSSTGTPRKVEAGVYIFEHSTGAPVVKFGPFNAESIRDWARGFSKPTGNTPLGNALQVAGDAVLKSSLSRKHVLVITDGVSNFGPAPAAVLPALKRTAQSKGATIEAHFVAFDVAAKVFEAVKKQGATVVAAANAKELDSQVQFILQRKILLEDEEPPKAKEVK
jgi:hypothetical protein